MFRHHPWRPPSSLVMRGFPAYAELHQRYASEHNKPACVFVDAIEAGGGAVGTAPDAAPAYVFDFVYPHARSPLCLHASLAAARLLLSAERPNLRVATAMRGQLRDGAVYIGLARQPVAPLPIAIGLPAQLLEQPGLRLASAPVVASVGSPKLLLELAEPALLAQLRPDLAAITAWGRAHGVNGCYVYTRRADGAFKGRNFNHLAPAVEESATGVAAGALTVHLNQGRSLYQGATLGRPCLMRTRLAGDQVLIGGEAEMADSTARRAGRRIAKLNDFCSNSTPVFQQPRQLVQNCHNSFAKLSRTISFWYVSMTNLTRIEFFMGDATC
ncbi:PhzF family phenazine biosynthesis protein [Rugamonas rubra]|uniref:Predicted epimerase YddE/YHI9, PhzF superfamily n=1 Tax=Rugamonas rubra TaxID=758825 RepID=A0A1I4JB56_9BURK|nr:PhzF family phenazine biosynthesis protein [Rugamonas rubra]SFL63808.1 Predicted epimerase YddE/YHI9, PhzF superfamily [Rugamonas rubra]